MVPNVGFHNLKVGMYDKQEVLFHRDSQSFHKVKVEMRGNAKLYA